MERVSLGSGVELAPEHAAASTRRSRLGIHFDLLEASQVDRTRRLSVVAETWES
jgi:hypothetical protein